MTKHQQNKKNKAILLALILGLSGIASIYAQPLTHIPNHLFTVNDDGTQVELATSNLQYIGSADTPYWKFADYPWEFFDIITGQNSSDQNVDRDLFGWATSGTDNGYQPWLTSTNISDYWLFSELNEFHDWGHNTISNDIFFHEENRWRTPTSGEWYYLLFSRSTPSGIRYAKANVNSVNGLILLPDNWSTSTYSLNNPNVAYVSYSSNTLTASQFETLEQAGAVFLPAAGLRHGTSVSSCGDLGYYWGDRDDYLIFINNQGGVKIQHSLNPYDGSGFSVRLVFDVAHINTVPSPTGGGTVTGAGYYRANTECTLQATPSEGYVFVNWTENGQVVSTNATYSFTTTLKRNLTANFDNSDSPIVFADDNVKNLCVAPATGWDINGDGVLTYTEAAAITDLGSVFKGNTDITSFNELVYFTGVTAIANYAFQNCTSLTSVVIPNSVTSIGNYAFFGCRAIATITVEAGNSYYDSRDNCNAIIETNTNTLITGCKNTIIPNSVTIIGQYAFYGCSGLTSVTIPNSVTSIGQSTFAFCTGLTSVTIPNSVTSIGYYAFQNCTGLSTLTIPNSVTSIGLMAFQHCTSISKVYYNATNCAGNTGYPSPFDGCGGNLIIGDNVESIPDYMFRGAGFTGSLTIPNSVTYIGYDAFYGCSGFTGNLTIPNSVTRINGEAFYGCSGFTGSLTIPNSVTIINLGAFYGCSGFTGSLTIPSSVTKIDGFVFHGCSFTTLITESSNIPSTGYDAFNGMNYTIPVYVPVGTVSDYQNANQWSNFTNIKSQINFAPNSNDQWSDDFNWSSGVLPTTEDVVCITDNCQLDTDANVLYVYIADNTKVLTVNSGKTLNTTYGIHIENPSQLVVEDGGQVKSDIPFSGIVQKHINAYTSNDDGWNFIASPVTENQSISGLIPSGETVYDLYYLDEENTYWRNYKVNAFEINHNQGYLYGNQAGTDISFSGALQPYVAEGVSIPLTKEGEGWNLVGNPFTFNAYANKPYYIINGRNVEAATSGAIAPCTGIVVKAEGTANETVKFTKDEPVTSSAPSNGSLHVVLDEANTRGASTGSAAAIDNAIVSFNEGTTLPKFRFGDNAQIYFPQNGEDYAIACAAKTGELPLNFKATKNAEYTLSVNPEGVEMEYLHLIDNMTGADVDLLQTSDYTFNAKTTDYTSRFRLVFSTNSVSEDTDGDDAAFAYISNGEIVLTDATADATLQIVDVTGRVVVSVGGHTRCVPTAGMTPGVYVLRLINGNDVKTQKMVIR